MPHPCLSRSLPSCLVQGVACSRHLINGCALKVWRAWHAPEPYAPRLLQGVGGLARGEHTGWPGPGVLTAGQPPGSCSSFSPASSGRRWVQRVFLEPPSLAPEGRFPEPALTPGTHLPGSKGPCQPGLIKDGESLAAAHDCRRAICQLSRLSLASLPWPSPEGTWLLSAPHYPHPTPPHLGPEPQPWPR